MRSTTRLDSRAATTRDTEVAQPAPPPAVEALRLLQRTAGNHAVASLLASESERARAMYGGVTLAEKPDHFPMGMGVAIPKGGTFQAPEILFEPAGRGVRVSVKEPTEPDWTIRVAKATDEADAYQLEGFTTISQGQIVGGGDGQAKRVANALLERDAPDAKTGAYRVAIMFPEDFRQQVALVEEEHADDFRQAHRLMKGLHETLVQFAGGLTVGTGEATEIPPAALESARKEVEEFASDDRMLVDDFALPMIKSMPPVKLKSGAGAGLLSEYDKKYKNREERITAILAELDEKDLRTKVIENLARQQSNLAAAAESSPFPPVYDAMRDEVRALEPKFVPPAMTAASGDAYTTATTKHWVGAYEHLLGLSKQRDMQRWHSGKFSVRKIVPPEQGLMGLLILETGPSAKFQLRQDSPAWITPSNGLYGAPVSWDLHEPWQ